MICIVAAAKTTAIAAAAFMLSWTHSVEKTRWEEDWRVVPNGIEIVAARVKGSGAGIDPQAGAVLRDGWWTWKPAVPAREELLLAASGATGDGWTLCTADQCVQFGAQPAEPVVVKPCEGP